MATGTAERWQLIWDGRESWPWERALQLVEKKLQLIALSQH